MQQLPMPIDEVIQIFYNISSDLARHAKRGQSNEDSQLNDIAMQVEALALQLYDNYREESHAM